MALSSEQLERVRTALERMNSREDMLALIDLLQSSEELHQFVLSYNVNDGFRTLWQVIRSPLCDRGHRTLCVLEIR